MALSKSASPRTRKTKLQRLLIGNQKHHAKGSKLWRFFVLKNTKLQMEPDQEFREFAESLMSHGVKFMIIGGYAVTAHGHPRYTGDIDFFVEKSPENAERIVKAIHDFFGPLPNVKIDNFLDDKRMSQLGNPPYRIDILVKILGVTFEEAFTRCEMLDLGGKKFPFIGLEDLKQNKRATGRYKDLGDLEALERLND
jgi:predicted nucleotidyltransferase